MLSLLPVEIIQAICLNLCKTDLYTMLSINKNIYVALNDFFWKSKLQRDYKFVPESGNYTKCYFFSKLFYSHSKNDDVKKYIQVPGAGVRHVHGLTRSCVYNLPRYKKSGCIYIIDTVGRLWRTTPDLSDFQTIATPTPVECFAANNGYGIVYKDINNVYYIYHYNFTDGNPIAKLNLSGSEPLQPMMALFDDQYICLIDINNRAYIISAYLDKIIRLKSKDTKRFRYIGGYSDIVATIDCYSSKLYVFVLDLSTFSVKKRVFIDRDVEKFIVEWNFLVYKKTDGSVFYFKTRSGHKIDGNAFVSSIIKLDGVTDIWRDDNGSKVYCQTEEKVEIPPELFNKVTSRVRTVSDRGSYQILYDPN